MCVTRCNFFATDICIFRAAAAAEEDGDYGAISVIVLFLVLGCLLTLVVLYKRSVDRKLAKKDGDGFTGARYRREPPFGADFDTVEINRGDVGEGEAMEMRTLPPAAEADVDANADRDPDGIQVDVHAYDERDEFVNAPASLNIESTR